MKFNQQESEDCDAPVWQQLLPATVTAPSPIENNEVRVDIPADEPSPIHEEKLKKTNSSWIPFAPSWSERQRIRHGGETFRPQLTSNSTNGSTEGDPNHSPKSPIEKSEKSQKSSSSPLMRLVIILDQFQLLDRSQLHAA